MDAKQLPLAIRLRDTSVFASYFPGRNRSVVDALQALVSAWYIATSGAAEDAAPHTSPPRTPNLDHVLALAIRPFLMRSAEAMMQRIREETLEYLFRIRLGGDEGGSGSGGSGVPKGPLPGAPVRPMIAVKPELCPLAPGPGARPVVK